VKNIIFFETLDCIFGSDFNGDNDEAYSYMKKLGSNLNRFEKINSALNRFGYNEKINKLTDNQRETIKKLLAHFILNFENYNEKDIDNYIGISIVNLIGDEKINYLEFFRFCFKYFFPTTKLTEVDISKYEFMSTDEFIKKNKLVNYQINLNGMGAVQSSYWKQGDPKY